MVTTKNNQPIITIGNRYSSVDNLPYGASTALYDHVSYDVPGAEWVIATKPGWDGKKHLFKKNKREPSQGTFLTGLLSYVAEFIYKEFGLIPKVVDNRKKPEKNLNIQWNDKKYSLREYQSKVVSNCIEKSRGIIECATGGGKTIIVAKIIQELGVSPFIFYVLTKDLMYQSQERLQDAMPGTKIGIIGDGNCDIQDINIMTVQTATRAYDKDLKADLKKEEDIDEEELQQIKEEDLSHIEKRKQDITNLVENAVGIYFDEAHHAPCATAKDIILLSPNAYYTFGGSATPCREDNADLLLEGLFGKKRCHITASFLISEGFLVRPDIYFIKLSKEAERVDTYNEDYEKNIVENIERNNHIISIAKSLTERKLPTMILVRRVDHGKYLAEKIPGARFVYGDSAKKHRKDSLKEFADREFPVLVATVIADEGLDIPILSALVLAGGGKSKTRCKQRIGRVIRKHKDKKCALVFDFIDNGRWVRKHSHRRKKILEEESEFNIKVLKSFKSEPTEPEAPKKGLLF